MKKVLAFCIVITQHRLQPALKFCGELTQLSKKKVERGICVHLLAPIDKYWIDKTTIKKDTSSQLTLMLSEKENVLFSCDRTLIISSFPFH